MSVSKDENIFTSILSSSYQIGYNLLTTNFNSQGNVLWQKTYSIPENFDATQVAMFSDNSKNSYVIGNTMATINPEIGYYTTINYLLLRYDSLGNEKYNFQFNEGGTSYLIPNKIIVDKSGNTYILALSQKGTLWNSYLEFFLNFDILLLNQCHGFKSLRAGAVVPKAIKHKKWT